MSNYQKVYMNQIHSSSLLCQLAQMWKSQMLCDAIIRTGSIITKAHRVVLVAACPMLQSMENAAAGSHLEVRLAADIKQEAVNTFLQYLYEGFMMLTEENCRDVEKVARLLQVDSVIKCCADFYKCLQSKTGAFVPSNYKYSFQDLVEFRHVRTTDLQKTTQEKMMKRTSEFFRPGSPGSKRQRIHAGDHSPDVSVIGSDRADDAASMAQSYKPPVPDPWDRVPYMEAGMSSKGTSSKPSQPGVIDIIEESLELVQHDPHDKDGQGSSQFSSQKSGVSIAVASQFNTEPDVSVVNISQNKDQDHGASSSTPSCQRGNISVSPHTVEDSGGPSLFTSHRQQTVTSQHDFSPQILHEQSQKLQGDYSFSNFTQGGEGSQKFTVMKSQQSQGQRSSEMGLTTPTKQTPSLPQLSSQPKPYAIGSANQGMASPSSSLGSPSSGRNIPRRTPVPVSGPIMSTTCSQEMGYSEDTGGPSSIKTDDSSSGDLVPDLTIVKVERAHSQSESEEPVASSSGMNIAPETGGLDMHVDDDGGGFSSNQHSLVLEEGEDLSDTELEEWAKGEMSNEGNISGDQAMMQSSFKGHTSQGTLEREQLVESIHLSRLQQTRSCNLLGAEGEPVSSFGTEKSKDEDEKTQRSDKPTKHYRSVYQTHVNSSMESFKYQWKRQGYLCSICNVSLQDKETLKQHLLREHKHEFSYFCYICGKGFKSYAGYYNHNKQFHKQGSDCPACEVCGKKFPCASRLELHKRRHSSLQPFYCKGCGKSYKYKQSLKDHACTITLLQDLKRT